MQLDSHRNKLQLSHVFRTDNLDDLSSQSETPSSMEQMNTPSAPASPSSSHWSNHVEAAQKSDTRVRPWMITFGNEVDCVFEDLEEIVHVDNKHASGATIKFCDYDVQANG